MLKLVKSFLLTSKLVSVDIVDFNEIITRWEQLITEKKEVKGCLILGEKAIGYLLLQTYLIYETTFEFEDAVKEDELRQLILFQWRSLFNFSIVNFGTDNDFDELEVDWDPSSNYWNIFHDLEISRSKKLAKDERLLVIHLKRGEHPELEDSEGDE